MHNYAAKYSNSAISNNAHRICYCHDHNHENVAELLRRWIANPLIFERESPNLSVIVNTHSFIAVSIEALNLWVLPYDIIPNSMLPILQHSANIMVFERGKMRVRCKYVLFFQSQIFFEFSNSKLTTLKCVIFLCNSVSTYSACGPYGKHNAVILNLIAREYLKGSITNFPKVCTFWLVENYAISP